MEKAVSWVRIGEGRIVRLMRRRIARRWMLWLLILGFDFGFFVGLELGVLAYIWLIYIHGYCVVFWEGLFGSCIRYVAAGSKKDTRSFLLYSFTASV